MTFGDHVTEGTKTRKRASGAGPYEDGVIGQLLMPGKEQELRGSSFGVSMKDLRRDCGNILVASSQKPSDRDDLRIEQQLAQPSSSQRENGVMNPFQTN